MYMPTGSRSDRLWSIYPGAGISSSRPPCAVCTVIPTAQMAKWDRSFQHLSNNRDLWALFAFPGLGLSLGVSGPREFPDLH